MDIEAMKPSSLREAGPLRGPWLRLIYITAVINGQSSLANWAETQCKKVAKTREGYREGYGFYDAWNQISNEEDDDVDEGGNDDNTIRMGEIPSPRTSSTILLNYIEHLETMSTLTKNGLKGRTSTRNIMIDNESIDGAFYQKKCHSWLGINARAHPYSVLWGVNEVDETKYV
jgi:hypothetical protein